MPNFIYPVGVVPPQSPTSHECTVRRTITQADVDAGEYTNTANHTMVYFDGMANEQTQVLPPASATVPSTATPSFTINKTSTDTYQNVGDPINYTFTITNTGLITLSSVTVADPLIPGLACTLTNIPPLRDPPTNVATCMGQYLVDQGDLDAGQVDNETTASATFANGVTLTEIDTETVLIDPAFATRLFELTKTPSSLTFTATGPARVAMFEFEKTATASYANVGDLVVPRAARGRVGADALAHLHSDLRHCAG